LCVDRDGDRWHVDETYVKVTGRWVYLYRAVDQFGQVIDVYASTRRDSEAAHGFFERARKATGVVPMEVIPLTWHPTGASARLMVRAMPEPGLPGRCLRVRPPAMCGPAVPCPHTPGSDRASPQTVPVRMVPSWRQRPARRAARPRRSGRTKRALR
jgi:hypothetical protein